MMSVIVFFCVVSTISAMEPAKQNHDFYCERIGKSFYEKLSSAPHDLPHLNDRDGNGWAYLHYAAMQASDVFTKKLLDAEADVHVGDNNGWTPLHFAAQSGSYNNVIALLNGGANVLAADKYGRIPLYIAHLWGHDDLVSFLYQYTCAALCEIPLTAALFIMIKNKFSLDDIQAISSSIDLREPLYDEKGRTLMFVAARVGRADVIAWLLESGVNINIKNTETSLATPLFAAIALGNKELVQWLINCGANVNACACNELTPLHLAALCGKKEIVLLLIANKAKICVFDSNYQSPLALANIKGYTECAAVITQAIDAQREYIKKLPKEVKKQWQSLQLLRLLGLDK